MVGYIIKDEYNDVRLDIYLLEVLRWYGYISILQL